MHPWSLQQSGEQSPVNPVVTNAPLAAVGTVYTVTSTNNSGTGTLRQAITDANDHAGADTISFNISGTGVNTITPTSALPKITGQVILDATTQPGYSGTPLIRIHGTSAGSGVNGLYFANGSDGSTIRGLMIHEFTRRRHLDREPARTTSRLPATGSAPPGTGSTGCQLGQVPIESPSPSVPGSKAT